jgi:Domain of unknown function (DUF1772)
MLLLTITIAIAGVFFGAALYVNLVEHPARVSCGAEAAVHEFRPSYRRGAVMQASLSGIGCVLGLAAAWQLHDMQIAIGAVLLGLPIPVTLLFIAPTNKQLLSSAPDRSASQTLELLVRWNRRHWVRTVLGGLAFLVLLLARSP